MTNIILFEQGRT